MDPEHWEEVTLSFNGKYDGGVWGGGVCLPALPFYLNVILLGCPSCYSYTVLKTTMLRVLLLSLRVARKALYGIY
jgi:hypothetical protein